VQFHGSIVEMVERFPGLLNPPGIAITVLAAPMRTQGGFAGHLCVRRYAALPFGPREIAVLETFADQAVIALENSRLFNELQERNREVTEALEQQAGMAEVLRVIGSNPTDLSAVFRSLAETLKRLVSAKIGFVGYLGGGTWRAWSSALDRFSEVPAIEVPDVATVPNVAARESRSIHVWGAITEWESEYPDAAAFHRSLRHTEAATAAIGARSRCSYATSGASRRSPRRPNQRTSWPSWPNSMTPLGH